MDMSVLESIRILNERVLKIDEEIAHIKMYMAKNMVYLDKIYKLILDGSNKMSKSNIEDPFATILSDFKFPLAAIDEISNLNKIIITNEPFKSALVSINDFF